MANKQKNIFDNLNIEQLGQWIQPQHLHPDKLYEYKKKFSDNAISVGAISNFLKQEHALMLHEFMTKHATYKKQYGLFSTLATTKEKWLEADESDKFYTYSKIVNVNPESQGLNTFDFNIFLYLKFLKVLGDEPFLNLVRLITGSTINELEGHAYGNAYYKDDYLNPHTDQSNQRLIAFMIYLNPNWKNEFGGDLHFVDHNNNEQVLKYEFNTLILFNVNKHKQHYISKIKQTNSNQPRLSIGGWYK